LSAPKVFASLFTVFVVISSMLAQAQQTDAAPTTGSGQPGVTSSSPHNLSMADLWAKNTEDFSTPALTGSEFAPTNPLTYEKDDEGSFTREIVRVGWRLGDPIDIYILRPAGNARSPLVMYLYSYPFETDRFLRKDFCDFLVRDAYTAIGFATALTGQRYHDRPMKEWFVSELKESLATSSHDVQLVLNYLATRKDLNLDMDHVGIFGDGSGATIAILAASVDSRIKTLDLLDPWGDWPDWMAKSTLVPEEERARYVKPEFLAGVANFDPIKILPTMLDQKIRMRDIKTVTVTPNTAKEKIESSAPQSVEILRYENAEDFRTAGATEGFDWIKAQIKPLPQSTSADATPQGHSAPAAKRQ